MRARTDIETIAQSAGMTQADLKRLTDFFEALHKETAHMHIEVNIPLACQNIQRLNTSNNGMSALNKGMQSVILVLLTAENVEDQLPSFLKAFSTAYHSILAEKFRMPNHEPAWRFAGPNSRLIDKQNERAFYRQAFNEAKTFYKTHSTQENADITVSIPSSINRDHAQQLISCACDRAKQERICFDFFKAEVQKVKDMLGSITHSPCLLSGNIVKIDAPIENANVSPNASTIGSPLGLTSQEGKKNDTSFF